MYQLELIIGVVMSCLLHIDTIMAQLEAQPGAPPSQTPDVEVDPPEVEVDLPHSSDDMPKMNGSNCMDPVSQPQYTGSLSIYRLDFQATADDACFVM